MSLGRSHLLAAGAVATALSVGFQVQGTMASGIPANKVAASGSTVEELHAVPGKAAKVLLTERVKINNPTDLILTASAECAIFTQVTTSGGRVTGTPPNTTTAPNETARAQGKVTMWVTIDGKPVPVASGDTDGRVVFCDRIQEQESNLEGDESDEQDNFVRSYHDTRNANAFSWLALNVGINYPGTDNNEHVVQLWAEFETNTAGRATARAGVGNRTLVLEPGKAATREAVTIS